MLQHCNRVATECTVDGRPQLAFLVLLQDQPTERGPVAVALHSMHGGWQLGAVAIAILGKLERQILEPDLPQPVQRLKRR